jgi:hypothetical protein
MQAQIQGMPPLFAKYIWNWPSILMWSTWHMPRPLPFRQILDSPLKWTYLSSIDFITGITIIRRCLWVDYCYFFYMQRRKYLLSLERIAQKVKK